MDMMWWCRRNHNIAPLLDTHCNSFRSKTSQERLYGDEKSRAQMPACDRWVAYRQGAEAHLTLTLDSICILLVPSGSYLINLSVSVSPANLMNVLDFNCFIFLFLFESVWWIREMVLLSKREPWYFIVLFNFVPLKEWPTHAPHTNSTGLGLTMTFSVQPSKFHLTNTRDQTINYDLCTLNCNIIL